MSEVDVRWPWQTREDALISILDQQLALGRSLAYEHAQKVARVRRELAENEEGGNGHEG